jgi:hypothetical protein
LVFMVSVRVTTSLWDKERKSGEKPQDLHSHLSKAYVGNSRDGRHELDEVFLLQRTKLLLERIYFLTLFCLNRFSRYSAGF